jgi:hypothetical protein
MGLWIFAAVALVIVGSFLVFERQRRDALGQVAAELGFAFTGGQHRLPEPLDRAGFYLFTQGPPQILNRLDGERAGYRVSIFGFGYSAATGEEGSRELPVGDVGKVENRLQTVVWLSRPVLPDFDLSPTRHMLRRVGAMFSMQPFGFDGQPAFRDRWLLYVRDQSTGRRFFVPKVLAALAEDPGWFVEGRGDQWLVYRLSHRVPPGEIDAYLDRAIGLVNLIAGRSQGDSTPAHPPAR